MTFSCPDCIFYEKKTKYFYCHLWEDEIKDPRNEICPNFSYTGD